jgi:molybdopterin molybdotransferase
MRVPLIGADRQVLAETVLAPIDLPPFDNSAVDGFAIRFADLTAGAETELPVAGRIAAGGAPEPDMRPGHAIRIFTGAPMPPGTDTVFMQEDVRLQGGRVVLPAGLTKGANRREAGEDLRQGRVAFQAGRRLAPPDLALLAALGIAEVDIRAPLRVAVFSTGNEIVSPGEMLRPWSLYDANRILLLSMLRRLGCATTDLGILPDRRDAVADALHRAAATHDLLITSGGVSAGEEDHVKAAIESSGALTLWRIAVKPGRPVAMGIVDGTPIIGLPGNPVAVFVTFVHVARVLVACLSGETYSPPEPLSVLAGFAYRKKEGRREYVRVRLARGANGSLVARRHPREGAGVLTSLTETDGLAVLPETLTSLAESESVGFMPYASLI